MVYGVPRWLGTLGKRTGVPRSALRGQAAAVVFVQSWLTAGFDPMLRAVRACCKKALHTISREFPDGQDDVTAPLYNDFDIILNPYPTHHQLVPTLCGPCGVFCVVTMVIGC